VASHTPAGTATKYISHKRRLKNSRYAATPVYISILMTLKILTFSFSNFGHERRVLPDDDTNVSKHEGVTIV
jgi:hypothetical protein